MKQRYSSVFNIRLSLPRVIQFGAVAGVIAVGSTAQAVDYIKANNENNLNTTTAWLDSSGNPATSFSPNGTGSTDLWTWDNRVTNANSGGDGVNNVRASDQGVRTIRILDPEVAVAISLDTATAGRTMTYTAGGGIDMANATQDLTFVNGFYRATGGVAASFNVKTGRKLEFLSAVTQNVRNSSTGGTVSMNTDGVSAGRIVIGGVFNPTNVIIGAGVVEFNSTTGTTRLGTSATTVNGGTLVVNNTSGSATGAGSVTIKNTATLTGRGIMTGLVTVESGATIIPRENAIGSLTAGSLTLAANPAALSHLVVESKVTESPRGSRNRVRARSFSPLTTATRVPPPSVQACCKSARAGQPGRLPARFRTTARFASAARMPSSSASGMKSAEPAAWTSPAAGPPPLKPPTPTAARRPFPPERLKSATNSHYKTARSPTPPPAAH